MLKDMKILSTTNLLALNLFSALFFCPLSLCSLFNFLLCLLHASEVKRDGMMFSELFRSGEQKLRLLQLTRPGPLTGSPQGYAETSMTLLSPPYTGAHTLSQTHTGTYVHTHRHMYTWEGGGATEHLQSTTASSSVSGNVL